MHTIIDMIITIIESSADKEEALAKIKAIREKEKE